MFCFVLPAEGNKTFVGSIQLLVQGPRPKIQKVIQKHPQSKEQPAQDNGQSYDCFHSIRIGPVSKIGETRHGLNTNVPKHIPQNE